MKTFFQKIILFIVPIILFVAGAEYIIRKIPNDYLYKNMYLKDNSEDIEVLVLGSSHGFFGINPEFLYKKGFNAAHVSQSLNFDYFIFNKYKDNLLNLKTIILPISYFTLFSQLQDGPEGWRAKYYSIYYNGKFDYNFLYNYEIIGRSPFGILTNVYKYIKGKNNITVSKLGFGLGYSDGKQSDLVSTGLEAAKRHTKEDFKLLDTNLLLLQKIITESKEKNIEIILFTPPARESYILNLDKKQLSIMEKNIAKIIVKHSNVKYFNYLNDGRFTDVDFRDADHLNGVGAKKLTRILNQSIQKNVSFFVN